MINNLVYLIEGICKENGKESSQKVAKICAKYIQNKGTVTFSNSDLVEFNRLVKEITNIEGIEQSRQYVKKQFQKRIGSSDTNYTLLFEKSSALVEYIAFYNTVTEYNSKYPYDEKTYKAFLSDYSHKSTRNMLEYLYGPAYVTTQKYVIYTVGENSKEIGKYTSLDSARKSLDVE